MMNTFQVDTVSRVQAVLENQGLSIHEVDDPFPFIENIGLAAYVEITQTVEDPEERDKLLMQKVVEKFKKYPDFPDHPVQNGTRIYQFLKGRIFEIRVLRA